jgi:hypothetical protein
LLQAWVLTVALSTEANLLSAVLTPATLACSPSTGFNLLLLLSSVLGGCSALQCCSSKLAA